MDGWTSHYPLTCTSSNHLVKHRQANSEQWEVHVWLCSDETDDGGFIRSVQFCGSPSKGLMNADERFWRGDRLASFGLNSCNCPFSPPRFSSHQDCSYSESAIVWAESFLFTLFHFLISPLASRLSESIQLLQDRQEVGSHFFCPHLSDC